MFREKEDPKNFHLFRNMFPEDFLRLLCGSTAIVGNSSVAIRECSYLGVPAVNIGTRQQGRERGRNVIDVDHERTEIADAIAGHIRNAPRIRSGRSAAIRAPYQPPIEAPTTIARSVSAASMTAKASPAISTSA